MTKKYQYYVWPGSDVVNSLISRTLHELTGLAEVTLIDITKDSDHKPSRKLVFDLGNDSDLKDAILETLKNLDGKYKLYRRKSPSDDIVYVRKPPKKKVPAKIKKRA